MPWLERDSTIHVMKRTCSSNWANRSCATVSTHCTIFQHTQCFRATQSFLWNDELHWLMYLLSWFVIVDSPNRNKSKPFRCIASHILTKTGTRIIISSTAPTSKSMRPTMRIAFVVEFAPSYKFIQISIRSSHPRTWTAASFNTLSARMEFCGYHLRLHVDFEEVEHLAMYFVNNSDCHYAESNWHAL